MAHEHLKLTASDLYDTAYTDDETRAEEITAHFRNQQAAHEAAKTPLENPLDLLQDAKVLCQEILDKLEGCPAKMTADRLGYILTAADGDMEAAAEMINEQMFEALNK